MQKKKAEKENSTIEKNKEAAFRANDKSERLTKRKSEKEKTQQVTRFMAAQKKMPIWPLKFEKPA